MGRPHKNPDNLLVKWLVEKRLRQQDFAKILVDTDEADNAWMESTYRQYVSLLCRNKLIPDLRLAFMIEDVTRSKVPARSWLDENIRSMPDGYKKTD